MTIPTPDSYELAGDDVVVPFAVEPLDVRGRAIQLGPMLDKILKRHEYPNPICHLLGEQIALTILLGSSLKFQGNFILQTQSDGPVSLTVVDFTTPGFVRAYARFDTETIDDVIASGKTSPLELLGQGVMAMTIDQGPDMQRYQGIVPLDGTSVEEAAHQYFRQSEQIPTRVRLSVAQIMRRADDGSSVETTWRAGGIITQFLPESEERVRIRDLPSGADDDEFDDGDEDDAWVEASELMDTVGDDEITDPQINSERLLYRLFNEHGVRVFPGQGVEDRCSCSREKVISLVREFGDDDDAEVKSGKREDVTTKCEFCGTVYVITADELAL
ncbi:MAG: Hsp33 family molecular chaperone [Pseudomonadota bacterium]